MLSSRLRDCFQNLPAGGRCKVDYRVTIYLPRWAALPITSIFGPAPHHSNGMCPWLRSGIVVIEAARSS